MATASLHHRPTPVLPLLTCAMLASCSSDRETSAALAADSAELHRLVAAELDDPFANGAVLQDLQLRRVDRNLYSGGGMVPGVGRIGVEVVVHDKVWSYSARLLEPAASQGIHTTLDWSRTGEIPRPR
jgi:hypothetical protein